VDRHNLSRHRHHQYGDGVVMTTRSSISVRVDNGLSPRPGASWRVELGLGATEPVIVPDHVLDMQAHRINLKPADITSAVCGDPLPGESALDRLPAPKIAPTQEPAKMQNPADGAYTLSARQKRRRAFIANAEPTPSSS
jgi:hypothetical protein